MFIMNYIKGSLQKNNMIKSMDNFNTRGGGVNPKSTLLKKSGALFNFFIASLIRYIFLPQNALQKHYECPMTDCITQFNSAVSVKCLEGIYV